MMSCRSFRTFAAVEFKTLATSSQSLIGDTSFIASAILSGRWMFVGNPLDRRVDSRCRHLKTFIGFCSRPSPLGDPKHSHPEDRATLGSDPRRRLEPANSRRAGAVFDKKLFRPPSLLLEQQKSEKSHGVWGTGPPGDTKALLASG